MTETTETIGQRLRALRKELNMGQIAFSKELGIPQSRLSYIELDQNEISPSIVQLLYTRYSVDPNWLINGIGDRKAIKSIEKPTVQSLSGEVFTLKHLTDHYQGRIGDLMRRVELLENEVKAIKFKLG